MAPKCQVQRNRYVLRFHENRYAKNAEPVPSNRFVNRFLAVQAEPVRIGSTHWTATRCVATRKRLYGWALISDISRASARVDELTLRSFSDRSR